MGCEPGGCKTSTSKDIFIMTPSLEEWPTKAREAPSSPYGKSNPAGHQPSISLSWDKK